MCKAVKESKITSRFLDDETTFSKWKDAIAEFSKMKVLCHKDAVFKVVALPTTTNDIGELMSKQHLQAKLQCFLKRLSNMHAI